MRTRDRSIMLAAAIMTAALVSMIMALIRPTPLTLGLFLGIGPLGSVASIGLFLRSVLQDLRRRRVL
jgi:hypothetical protein